MDNNINELYYTLKKLIALNIKGIGYLFNIDTEEAKNP